MATPQRNDAPPPMGPTSDDAMTRGLDPRNDAEIRGGAEQSAGPHYAALLSKPTPALTGQPVSTFATSEGT